MRLYIFLPDWLPQVGRKIFKYRFLSKIYVFMGRGAGVACQLANIAWRKILRQRTCFWIPTYGVKFEISNFDFNLSLIDNPGFKTMQGQNSPAFSINDPHFYGHPNDYRFNKKSKL